MSRSTSLELGHAVQVSRAPASFPASLPWPVLTRAEALRAGVSPGRLRAPDLARPRPGSLVRGGRTAGETEIVSAYCRSDPEAVAVGLTAARMQGMPPPEHLERSLPRPRVHISLPQGRVSSDPVVRWHQFVPPPDQVREARFAVDPLEDGSTVLEAPVRLTTRARTWRDLAPDLSEFWLIAIGDHLVRRPRPELEHGRTAPWCTLEEPREQCTGRHAATLRAALRAVRVGADSPRETMLRLAFARAGLPDPLLNAPLIGPDGRRACTSRTSNGPRTGSARSTTAALTALPARSAATSVVLDGYRPRGGRRSACTPMTSCRNAPRPSTWCALRWARASAAHTAQESEHSGRRPAPTGVHPVSAVGIRRRDDS
uniref:hypothetical protein n=1 Tax=Brachybacterium sp. GPGPB12 TaxID=3023517 RepID=UPI004049E838